MRLQSRRPKHTSRTRPMQRASPELPTRGYALVVDGHMKAQFKTREGARKGAENLKRRFPMLQNAEARLTEEWQITPGHDATPRQTAPQ